MMAFSALSPFAIFAAALARPTITALGDPGSLYYGTDGAADDCPRRPGDNCADTGTDGWEAATRASIAAPATTVLGKFMEDSPLRQERHRLFATGPLCNRPMVETLRDCRKFGHRTAARIA